MEPLLFFPTGTSSSAEEKRIVSCVPYAVKAEAVKNALQAKEVTKMVPATLLKIYEYFILYLDEDSAAGIMK